jgi:hypothetical protein
MLLEHLEQNENQNPKRLIGGRYLVTSVERIAGGGDSDFLRHVMVAEDTWSKPPQVVRMPITQAGLKFSGRKLCVDEIQRASTLLDEHNAWLNENNALLALPANPADADKMILSFAGIGRNATLITYRVISAAIDDGKVTEESLDFALNAEIWPNRVRRGPRYVHTPDQLVQLRAALSVQIAEQKARIAKRDSATNPIPS